MPQSVEEVAHYERFFEKLAAVEGKSGMAAFFGLNSTHFSPTEAGDKGDDSAFGRSQRSGEGDLSRSLGCSRRRAKASGEAVAFYERLVEKLAAVEGKSGMAAIFGLNSTHFSPTEAGDRGDDCRGGCV